MRVAPTVHVLRDLGLGDLLVALPALRLLARALPDHRLVLHGPAWVHEVPGFPAGVPDDGTVPDVLVNLHGRGPQSHERLDALVPDDAPIRRIGHAAPSSYPVASLARLWDGPAWTDDPHRPERRRWCDLLAATGLVDPDTATAAADDLRLPPPPTTDPGVTIVHPGAAFGAKRWPVERFAAVARALADAGHRVVVTGGPDDAPVTAAVPGTDLAGRTGIGELCALVAHARLVVCGDTGISHVATAYGTHSVTLFGPVGPEQWGPPAGGPHVTLTDAALRRGDRFADDPDPALLAVSVDDVLGKIATLPRVAG